jgi:hypothetical protein
VCECSLAHATFSSRLYQSEEQVTAVERALMHPMRLTIRDPGAQKSTVRQTCSESHDPATSAYRVYTAIGGTRKHFAAGAVGRHRVWRVGKIYAGPRGIAARVSEIWPAACRSGIDRISRFSTCRMQAIATLNCEGKSG